MKTSKKSTQSHDGIYGRSYDIPKERTCQHAKLDHPVLFVGETGSGKELFADLYMRENRKRSGKHTTVNCASFTSNELLSSEIFGHAKGAFTGAANTRKGLLASCDDGIVFLDEIGDATPAFQAAILRVAEGRNYRPIGSDQDQPANARLIAATNSVSKVREDLKQRFHIVLIPPLQIPDIPVLAEHFHGRALTAEALKELMSYDYSGNIRELKKRCERLYVDRGETIFLRKGNKAARPINTFHYDRYEKEYQTWQECIQPIVTQYKANLKYKYMPKTADARDTYERILRDSMSDHQIEPFLKELSRSMVPTWMDDKAMMVPLLCSIVDAGALPFLLEDLHLVREKQPMNTQGSLDVSPLFDMNYKEAQDAFACAYLNHHLRKHRTHAETAKAIGFGEKSGLTSRLQRLREKGYSI